MTLLPILLAPLILLTPPANSSLFSKKQPEPYTQSVEKLKEAGKEAGSAIKQDVHNKKEAVQAELEKARGRIAQTTSDFSEKMRGGVEAIRKLNLNTANAKTLQTALGINRKAAREIVRYRNNKRFKSVAQLREIKALSKAHLDRITGIAKDIITLD